MKEYKNIEEFQEALRLVSKTCTVNDCPDVVKVGDIVYTMDNYDAEGKEISFGNKRTFKGLLIETKNRYSYNGFCDAVVSESNDCIRNDISYED